MFDDRGVPASLADLDAALAVGALKETHRADHKARLPPPSELNNTHLAIDLASFAVDGGELYIGVTENRATDQFSVTPFPLEGAAERLEQIARSRLDPPLTIRCIPLRAEPTDRDGCLVVVIPESPEAPHMVGRIYRGRGDKTNIELGDGEVRRIRAERERAHDQAKSQLQEWVARDPFPEGRHVHMFLVAEPVTARRGQLLSALSGDWNGLFRDRLLAGGAFHRDLPTLGWNDVHVARAHGRALVSYALSSARMPVSDVTDPEGQSNELEVRENGGLRFYASRASDARGGEEGEQLFSSFVHRFTSSFVQVTANVGAAAGYSGAWHLGVALQPLRGVRLWTSDALHRFNTLYSDESYREELLVSAVDIETAALRVTGDLLNRLWRGLGAAPEWVIGGAAQGL
jgi:hypothetical protein